MSQLRIWTSLAASVAIATLGSATPVHGQQPDSATPDSVAIASGRAASGPVDPAAAPDTTKSATPTPSITLSDRRIDASVSLPSDLFQLSQGTVPLTAQAIATAAPSEQTATTSPEAQAAPETSAEAETTAGAPRSVQGLVELHAHQSTGNVILYVRDLPVMTFLGNPATAASSGNAALASDALKPSAAVPPTATVAAGEAALDRATAVAQQIEALYQQGLDASQIEYEWNSEDSRFWVTVEGDRLVAIDGATVLPEQTQNAAEDAWQVTNRLRRLLGGAAPIEPINQPPRPQRAAIDFNPPSPGVQFDGYRVVSSSMGHASWYGPGFSGRPTASGERFNPNDLTAAHRTLPFGTRVRVTYPRTGRSVVVRINDRGPFIRGRTIDLSAGAARQIGLYSSGVGQVQMEVLAPAPSFAAN